MKEISGDLFSLTIINFADAICITTNGVVKKTGKAVMGAGCALSAREKFKNMIQQPNKDNTTTPPKGNDTNTLLADVFDWEFFKNYVNNDIQLLYPLNKLSVKLP